MSDLFRCDYCGTLADTDGAFVFWSEVDQLDDGTNLCIPAIYCSPYCGRSATTRAGSGRG